MDKEDIEFPFDRTPDGGYVASRTNKFATVVTRHSALLAVAIDQQGSEKVVQIVLTLPQLQSLLRGLTKAEQSLRTLRDVPTKPQ